MIFLKTKNRRRLLQLLLLTMVSSLEYQVLALGDSKRSSEFVWVNSQVVSCADSFLPCECGWIKEPWLVRFSYDTKVMTLYPENLDEWTVNFLQVDEPSRLEYFGTAFHEDYKLRIDSGNRKLFLAIGDKELVFNPITECELDSEQEILSFLFVKGVLKRTRLELGTPVLSRSLTQEVQAGCNSYMGNVNTLWFRNNRKRLFIIREESDIVEVYEVLAEDVEGKVFKGNFGVERVFRLRVNKS